ncbi:MAG: SDR family NAD(P)-dependent oxidoreductase [Thermodesulfobacteriota bacterium]|nr:SDR family NAD(P)-dependent oxidoreductase [Thermodesulfobacteriota bacterium]
MQNSKVIIVTGASKGLGAAVSRWLGSVGAAVSLVARSKQELDIVADEIKQSGGKPLVINADVSDPEACDRIVVKTVDQFGRLDVVVNNAGILGPLNYIGTTDPAAWRYNLEVNIMAPFYLTRAALGELRKRTGRIVNVSSGASNTAIEAASAYCTAKAALNHFTRVLAAEEPEITAVAIRPGVVDTRMQKILREEGRQVMPSKWTDYYRNLKAEEKLEPPEVPGRVIAWLALNAPNDLTGQFLSYDDPGIAQPAVDFFKNT